MAPVSFSPRARSKKTPARSFYLDIALLEDYWVRRKYHHTISAPLVYALREALVVVEEEGLENRLSTTGYRATSSSAAVAAAESAAPA